MDQEPLVIEQIDEGEFFLSEFKKKYPVQVALWMKPTEDAQWYLYVASDQINDNNKREAHAEVLRLSPPLSTPFFDGFRVKLIGTDDACTQEALNVYRGYPARIPTRMSRREFGGVHVDGVYIYPPTLETSVS